MRIVNRTAVANHSAMPKPNRTPNGKARRYITEVSEQELELIEKDYITDKNINYKYLANKYNLYEKQLAFYGQRRGLAVKRSKHFKPIEAIEFKPLSIDKAKVTGTAVIETTQAIQSKVDKDKAAYLEAKSKSRSLALQQLRERIVLALHCSQADIDNYLEDPESLVRDMEALAIDEKAVKNFKALVETLDQVIRLERIEDGLSNNPKDQPAQQDQPQGRLIVRLQFDGEEEQSEELSHQVIEGQTIDNILT